MSEPWSPDSWIGRRYEQSHAYEDERALAAARSRLASLPPLVRASEIESLRSRVADAEEGRGFVLQGGDCAEVFDECRGERIEGMINLLQAMAASLARPGRPVTVLGRIAGQYAKPRSHTNETRDDGEGRSLTLPNYFGDLLNHREFSAEARRIDPERLVEAYHHSALTLNYIRSLVAERHLAARDVERSTPDAFFVSHDALNLDYEAAQTRQSTARSGHYLLTTHLPWLGERTRALDGAHVEFARGLRNPIGVKIGPSVRPDELLDLLARINPGAEAGKVLLITRLGARAVKSVLPPLVKAVGERRARVLWVCDPMHGNTRIHRGVKTRDFEVMVAEVEASAKVLHEHGARLGGVHLELTPDQVTECVGAGVGEDELGQRYTSACDPRLNRAQALAFVSRLRELLVEVVGEARGE